MAALQNGSTLQHFGGPNKQIELQPSLRNPNSFPESPLHHRPVKPQAILKLHAPGVVLRHLQAFPYPFRGLESVSKLSVV